MKDPLSEAEKNELTLQYRNDEDIKRLKQEPVYSAKDMIDMDKEKVKSMEHNIANLRGVLEKGFQMIERYRINEAILVIGDTGCGKSTLLSALVEGSDALYEKEIVSEVPVKKGGKVIKMKKTKKKVIDYKEEVKQRVFPIGHNVGKS